MKARWVVGATAAISVALSGCGSPHHSSTAKNSGNTGNTGATIVTLGSSGNSGSDISSTTVATTTTTTEDPAVAVKGWLSGNEGTLQALQNDLDSINTGGNSGDLTAVLSGCQQLVTDVANAQKVAPVPNPTIEGAWQASLADFATAAQDCVSGINNADLSLIAQYKSYISKGINAQASVIKQIQSLS